MGDVDFITAFGRLLQDGRLRDAFAADPLAVAEQIGLRPADHPAWRQLNPADVEVQAGVLLGKRLDGVKFFAPETCRRLGEHVRVYFHQYARAYWPPGGSPKAFDAFQFCQYLQQQCPGTVMNSEWNRLRFAFSAHRFALHWVEMSAVKGKLRSGMQLLLRGHGPSWREFVVRIGW